MKQSNNKVSFFSRYLTTSRRIREETNFKSIILSTIGAIIFSVLCILIPMLIAVNLLIYTKLQLLLTILIVLMLGLWPFLFFFAYYRIIINYHDKIKNIEIKYVYWVESIISSMLILIFSIVLATTILGGL